MCQTLWKPTKAEVSARYQQLLLQRMLAGKRHPGSGLYLHLKLKPTIHQIEMHRIQGQISKLKLWIQQLLLQEQQNDQWIYHLLDLVLKKIAGNIKKCAGCSKAFKSNVVGFQSLDDQLYCTIWPLSFFQQGNKCLAVSNVNEALQLNPVCPKVSSKMMPDSSLIVPSSLRQLMLERFQYDV